MEKDLSVKSFTAPYTCGVCSGNDFVHIDAIVYITKDLILKELNMFQVMLKHSLSTGYILFLKVSPITSVPHLYSYNL